MFNPNEQSDVAFYPAFPYLWRWTGLTENGIAVVNFSLFLLTIVFLAKEFCNNRKNLLLFLSIPLLVFTYLPYSESVFFVFGTVMLIGLNRKNYLITILGIIGCGLARPVSIVLVPVFLSLGFLKYLTWKETIAYSLAAVISLGLVQCIQYAETHVWFGSFITQKYWEHSFRLPHLPLKTWGDMLKADMLALLLGIFSCYLIVKNYLKGNLFNAFNVGELFSLVYTFLVCFMILFTQGGGLQSLSRYVLVSPFCFILMNRFMNEKFERKHYLIAVITVFIFWLTSGSFTHIRKILFSLISCAYVLTYFTLSDSDKKISNLSYMLLYLTNLSFQVYFFHEFSHGKWVG